MIATPVLVFVVVALATTNSAAESIDSIVKRDRSLGASNALAVTVLEMTCPVGGNVSTCSEQLEIFEWDQTYDPNDANESYDLSSTKAPELGHDLDDLMSELSEVSEEDMMMSVKACIYLYPEESVDSPLFFNCFRELNHVPVAASLLVGHSERDAKSRD